MGPITFVAPYFYNTVWYIFWLIVIWANVIYFIGSGEQKILRSDGHDPSQGVAVIISLIVIYYLGLRPLHSDFVDMKNYAEIYKVFAPTYGYDPPSLSKEWLWHDIMVFFQHNGFTVYEFFLFVEFVYVIGMLLSVIILTRNNLWVAMMFMFLSFSFLGYGENGIRNGMGCSVVMLALALLTQEGTPKKILSVFVMFLAMGIHRSVALPIVASLASIFAIKNPKTAMRFWIASLAISIVAGPLAERFFAALGFDERMEGYTSMSEDSKDALFKSTGFRLDFFIYSAFPLIMVWYVTVYRKFRDKTYHVIAVTYILCNAFWLMVIRAAYSNRFAYLSWFIYPLVILYPLLRMNLWEDQDRKTALILFAYTGFMFFMFFVYYFGSTGFRGFDQFWWR